MDKVKIFYTKNNCWGMTLSIDLHGCNHKIITNRRKIREFVIKVCKLIKVKRFGKCMIFDFGEKKKVNGFSMTQLIQTSLVSGHFVNENNRAYIDVFSCKYFNPHDVVKFCKNFFKAKRIKSHYTCRN